MDLFSKDNSNNSLLGQVISENDLSYFTQSAIKEMEEWAKSFLLFLSNKPLAEIAVIKEYTGILGLKRVGQSVCAIYEELSSGLGKEITILDRFDSDGSFREHLFDHPYIMAAYYMNRSSWEGYPTFVRALLVGSSEVGVEHLANVVRLFFRLNEDEIMELIKIHTDSRIVAK